MISAYVFYLLAFILIFSGVAVIAMRNPVHSVLFLILAFFNCAGLFLLLGAEFVAMILIIVYVGAVAVLFLFVVMMLDVDIKNLRKGVMQYIPVGLAVGGLILFELFIVLTRTEFPVSLEQEITVNNTEAIGNVLYTDYVFPFQLAGLILFVAMVGAIVLTLRKRPDVYRQSIKRQVTMKREDVVENKKISPGTGI